MRNEIGIVKRNAATEVLEQLKEMNAARGALAGRNTGTPVTALTGPRVSSAAMLSPPEKLDAKTQAELDQKAIELGILPPKSQEDQEIDRVLMEDSQYVPLSIPPSPRLTAREFLASQPRLLSFSKLESIDLVKGVVIIDSVEIDLPKEEVRKLTKKVLKLATDQILAQIKETMKSLNKPKELLHEAFPKTEVGPEV